MATHFTSSSYRLGSQVKLSMAKKIHPETGGWFLEAYSVMTNFRAKATNSIAKGTNSIAKATNSIAKICKELKALYLFKFLGFEHIKISQIRGFLKGELLPITIEWKLLILRYSITHDPYMLSFWNSSQLLKILSPTDWTKFRLLR